MREVNATMKYQIEKAVADIGVKVVFGSVEGVDNTGRNPEWEAERKVRLENLQKRFDGLDIHGMKFLKDIISCMTNPALSEEKISHPVKI